METSCLTSTPIFLHSGLIIPSYVCQSCSFASLARCKTVKSLVDKTLVLNSIKLSSLSVSKAQSHTTLNNMCTSNDKTI